jgi:thiol-disulfide isomerase/thioredoxin
LAAARAAAPVIVTLTLTLPLTLGAAGCGGSPRTLAPIPAASAAPLPALEYRLRTGEPWTSRGALGRVIVLDAWATYCKPCRKAFPKLGLLAAAYPDAVVIGVSVDEDDAVVEAFLREVPAAFAIARDPQRTLQFGPLAMTKLPTLLVVDRLGRVRFRREPMTEPDYDGLAGLIAALLAE